MAVVVVMFVLVPAGHAPQVAVVGGNVVGAGLFTMTSGEVEFDVRVATIGVLELFIMDTCTEPESPAKSDIVQTKEKVVVVQVPAGLVNTDPDTTVNGSSILSVDVPTIGENERVTIGIKVKSMPKMPIRRLVNCLLISMLDDCFETI